MFYLKQSTASQKARVLLVDDTDGKTPETGVTSPTVKLAKNNGSFGDPSDGTWAEQAYGWYTVQLDATDTATLGPLQLHVEKTGCRNFDDHGMVLPANIYDAWFGSDLQKVDAEVDEAIESYRLDELMAAALDGQPASGSLLGDLTEDDAGTQRFTQNALEQAPSGTGDWASDERKQIRKALGVSGESQDTTGSGHVDELLTRVPDAAPGANGGLPTVDASNRIAGIQGTTNTLDDLHDFDPASEDVNVSDTDLADLTDGIKGSPEGKTVKEAYEKADAVLTRVDALVGTPVVTDTAVSATGQDIARYRGDTAPIAFDLGRDITGAALTFTVKRRHRDAQSAALIVKSSAQSSEIEITDAESGLFVVKLAPDDTSGLLPDGRQATFVYDVEMTLEGAVETVAAGDFLLVPDVTTAP